MKKETIKKALALFLATSLMLSLAACGGKEDTKEDENANPPVSDQVEEPDADQDKADANKEETDKEEPNKEDGKEDAGKDEDKAPTSSTSKPSPNKPSTGKPPTTKPSTSKPEQKPASEKSLKTIMSHAYDGIKEDAMPMVGNTVLNSENFQSFAFIEKGKDYTGLASEAMIGSQAHSVVLVRVPKDVSAKSVAGEIKANANANKWVCVEAEKVIVKYHKQTVMLIMTYEDLAGTIASNFDKMYK